jgi:hypothetical protein
MFTDVTTSLPLFTCPVFTPLSPGYEAELAGIHANVVHTPEIVIGATSTDDVVAAVRHARAEGLPVAVLGGGHGVDPITAGMVISMQRMNHVSIDPDRKTATFGGGARIRDVVDAAAPFGLMPICGSTTHVGAVGYLLGGGISPLGRSHGYSSDYVQSMTVVSGTGEVLEASNFANQDLFWALRGGKTALGVVTEATIQLVELSTLYAGFLAFADEDAETVFRGWLAWTATADPQITSSFATIDFPDMEMAPPPFRGKRISFIRFAYPGDAARGAELVAPLRALAPALMDTVGPLPASQIDLIHMDPTDPLPLWEAGAQYRDLEPGFADAWVERFGPGKRSPLVMVELRHGGGAQRQDVIEGSAVTGRDADYTLFMATFVPPFFAEAAPAAARDMLDATAAWRLPTMNVNLLGDNPLVAAWSPHVLARIQTARQRVDPEGIFLVRW